VTDVINYCALSCDMAHMGENSIYDKSLIDRFPNLFIYKNHRYRC